MNIAIIVDYTPRKDKWNGYTIRYENVGISGTDQSFLLVAEYLAKIHNVYYISDNTINNSEFKNVKYKHTDFLNINNDIFDIIIFPSWNTYAYNYTYKNLKYVIVWTHCPGIPEESYIDNFIKNRKESEDCVKLKLNTITNWTNNFIKRHQPYSEKYFTHFTVPNALMCDMIIDKPVKEKNTFIFTAGFERGGLVCVEAFNRLSLENKHLNIFSYWPDDMNKIRSNNNITMHGSTGKKILFEYLSKTEYFIYPLVMPHYERQSFVHKDTFGCVIAEALAHEVIVLTYPVGALPELYEDTVAWLDFPKGSNIESLIDSEDSLEPMLNSEEAIQIIIAKINEIESNPSYKESLKRKGKQLVNKKFHPDIIGKGWEKEIPVTHLFY